MATTLLSSSPSNPLHLFSIKPQHPQHHALVSLHSLQNHHHSIFLIPSKPLKPPKSRPISSQSNNNNNDDSADVPDRLISAVCYFYPFFDGIQYGNCEEPQLQQGSCPDCPLSPRRPRGHLH
ncbi:protein TIC 20-v, chloroplastic [Cinnamomum micranthum f. kanehirae]|uniref:Protein TIC 20-v, chloroplastic n=1 Tax=Cinnamomum micranthum f. kanehirae TaxID=337451 RepID=A0A443PW21_9MAGN|nr:protein TIC 20-v, chloroplastic [Cinnamomum micranthum f. kanehirae]